MPLKASILFFSASLLFSSFFLNFSSCANLAYNYLSIYRSAKNYILLSTVCLCVYTIFL